jgi:outer membrane protein OmpA-like peptidoglycan-associated protein
METNEWHQISIIYKAKGGESTLLIGSFAPRRLWQTGNTVPPGISSPINKKIERDAYYYIDDVSMFEYKREKIDTAEVFNPYFGNQLIEAPDTEFVEPVTIEKMPSDVMMAFKNVLFQIGESILSPVSFPELDVIAAYLKVDPKLKIEIYGHTDNAGDDAKNLELSIKRAAAVGNYLIAKGVIANNVSSGGYGSSRPIESNETPEGRKQNRRVEFILKK